MFGQRSTLPQPRLVGLASARTQSQMHGATNTAYSKADRETDYYFMKALQKRQYVFTPDEVRTIGAIEQIPLATESEARDKMLRGICARARSEKQLFHQTKSVACENMNRFGMEKWKIAHEAVMSVITAPDAVLTDKQKQLFADYKKAKTLDTFMLLYNALISEVDQDESESESESDDESEGDSDETAEFEDRKK